MVQFILFACDFNKFSVTKSNLDCNVHKASWQLEEFNVGR